MPIVGLRHAFVHRVLMMEAGTRLEIPHLWAYFALDQILPVSFTQNLFLTAILVQDSQKLDGNGTWEPAPRTLQFMVVLTYIASLVAASQSGQRPSWLFPVLFSTRILLFAPYLVLQPSRGPGTRRALLRSLDTTLQGYRQSFAVLFLAGFLMQAVQTMRLPSKSFPWSTLKDDPAISALGYDFFLSIMGSFAYFLQVGGIE